jgi:hypothetical protein
MRTILTVLLCFAFVYAIFAMIFFDAYPASWEMLGRTGYVAASLGLTIFILWIQNKK